MISMAARRHPTILLPRITTSLELADSNHQNSGATSTAAIHPCVIVLSLTLAATGLDQDAPRAIVAEVASLDDETIAHAIAGADGRAHGQWDGTVQRHTVEGYLAFQQTLFVAGVKAESLNKRLLVDMDRFVGLDLDGSRVGWPVPFVWQKLDRVARLNRHPTNDRHSQLIATAGR